MATDTGISNSLILPLAHFCIDDEQSPNIEQCCPAWIAAPMLAEGIATPEEPYSVASCSQAQELFGEGSIAADMACYYLLNNRYGQLFITGLEDEGDAAEGEIFVPNSPTGSGTITLRIADTPYYVSVFTTDTPMDMAQAIADAINADPDALVTATTNGFAVVTITAKNGGTQGDDIPIVVNALINEESPPGLEIEITPMNGGAGIYNLETSLENLGNCCYDFMATPFCESLNNEQMENELQTRWSCDSLVGGRWYTTCCATFTDHITFLDSADYRYGSMIACCENAPYPPWRETAAYIGAAHKQVCTNTRDAWYGLELLGIPCTVDRCEEDCFDRPERNTLALNGASVNTCGPSGTRIIELESTIGVTDVDDVWRYPQTAYQTIRFMRDLADFVNDRFARSAIVDSLEDVPNGSSAVTPSVIVGEIRAWAISTQGDLIDNANNLDEFITIERNDRNPNRIDMCIRIDLINALRVLAVKIQPSLRFIE